MIAKFKEIEGYVEARTEQFDEEMKPYKVAMETIEAGIKKQLLDHKLTSFKSDYGTAYLSHVLSVKVDNSEKFLEFVKQGNWDFLDARPRKEPVKKWMDEHSAEIEGDFRLMTPTSTIGLNTTWIANCNIRKPT